MNNTIETNSRKNNNQTEITGVIKKIDTHTYEKNDIWYPIIFKEHYKIANSTKRKTLNTINRLFKLKNTDKITEYDFNIEGFDDLFVYLDINDNFKELFKIGNKLNIEIYKYDFFYSVKSIKLVP